MLRKVIKHARNGTLLPAVAQRLKPPVAPVYRWDSAGSPNEATTFLLSAARALVEASGISAVVLMGEPKDPSFHMVTKELHAAGITPVPFLERIAAGNGHYAGIICCYPDTKSISAAANIAKNDEWLNGLPFEFKPVQVVDYDCYFERSSHNSAELFISPLLIDPIDFFAIYEESLNRFEQKCDIRDYMDLCQIVKMIVTNSIPGPVAEFGSYRGHSGYLLARLLQAFGSDKHLYMFDTFAAFPKEEMGIDAFWSATHDVDFESVKSKFVDVDNVIFVKGDFTETFVEANLPHLAFAYVDCDSYRAVKFLCEQIFPDLLSSGGVMVFEDYGHAHCLGSRVAVHEYFDAVKCLKFFSQFSGMYMVAKL